MSFDDIAEERVTFDEAADLAEQLPPDASSAVYRAIHPDSWRWGAQEQLLATIADVAHWVQWSKTKDGQKKRPKHRPQRIKRPGVDPDDATKVGKGKRKGKAVADGATALPIDELKKVLSPL